MLQEAWVTPPTGELGHQDAYQQTQWTPALPTSAKLPEQSSLPKRESSPKVPDHTSGQQKQPKFSRKSPPTSSKCLVGALTLHSGLPRTHNPAKRCSTRCCSQPNPRKAEQRQTVATFSSPHPTANGREGFFGGFNSHCYFATTAES